MSMGWLELILYVHGKWVSGTLCYFLTLIAIFLTKPTMLM